ncbi:hypothetical protein DPMN_008864 [Dreissena polymorpha]|uniref:Uncharacterized protein n=1 Tax=Dreissena polymorpha TaxID=45954 RepID=A0A9D4RZM4_DREPO|nr:hypothetical protein DPMN_008864 [Dreissena polymorpha]
MYKNSQARIFCQRDRVLPRNSQEFTMITVLTITFALFFKMAHRKTQLLGSSLLESRIRIRPEPLRTTLPPVLLKWSWLNLHQLVVSAGAES